MDDPLLPVLLTGMLFGCLWPSVFARLPRFIDYQEYLACVEFRGQLTYLDLELSMLSPELSPGTIYRLWGCSTNMSVLRWWAALQKIPAHAGPP